MLKYKYQGADPMNENQKTKPPEGVVSNDVPVTPHNPLTRARHRREVLSQITLPLLMGSLIIIGLSVLTAWVSFAGAGDVSIRWAGISLIWLIMPALLLALILLGLLFGLIYLVTFIFLRLPPFALKVQDFFLLIKFQMALFDNKLVEPFLRLGSTKASASSLAHRLRSMR